MSVLIRLWYFLLFILIASLFFYGNVHSMYVAENIFSVENFYKDPQKYGGHKIQGFGKIINISENYFYFDFGQDVIKVYSPDIEKTVYGETVALINFRKDGNTELVDYHNYNYNYFLYAISFFALIVFVIIFLNEWKITSGGLENA